MINKQIPSNLIEPSNAKSESPKILKRAGFRFEFFPTPEQLPYFAQSFGHSRWVWNNALEANNTLYAETGKGLTYKEQSKRLSQLKKQEDTLWLNDVSSVALQQSLQHLNTAFTRFFEGESKFPKKKKKHSEQSFSLMKSAFTYEHDYTTNKSIVRLGRMPGVLNIKWSRRLRGVPTSVTITREADGKYFISFSVEIEVMPLPPAPNKIKGLDLGLTNFATLSDGTKFEHPRILQRLLKRLRRLNKSIARKYNAKKDKSDEASENFKRAKKKLAQLHAKIRRIRKDFLDKLSTKLIQENQLLVIETLNIKAMIKSLNKRLARSISDASWGMFIAMLEYKADWYGRRIIKAPANFASTQICNKCKNRNSEKIKLGVKTWVCEHCKAKLDRDENASDNLEDYGLEVLASEARTSC